MRDAKIRLKYTLQGVMSVECGYATSCKNALKDTLRQSMRTGTMSVEIVVICGYATSNKGDLRKHIKGVYENHTRAVLENMCRVWICCLNEE